MNRLEFTIREAAEGLKAGAFSSQELTAAYLKQAAGRNPSLNAYITILEKEAMEAARQSDTRRENGDAKHILDGVPLAIKDNLLIQGTRCTGGSKILENYQATYDATVIRKLKECGSVFLGKTNLDEFAMGSSTEHSAFGVTKNPHDLERVPGGSSGGSACAVAADLCVAALGTDTGGSIRQPAAFCGIVGFKPSYGRVSRSGTMAMASSLDQIGPMTKTVDDAAILFEAIASQDELDETTRGTDALNVCFPSDLKGVRIGVPKEAWGAGMTDGVRTYSEAALEVLRGLGAEIKEVSLPYVDEALAAYYILMPCEVSANLARLDGMRYGSRVPSDSIAATYAASRAQGFGEEVQRRILLGTYALSKGYYDAYYRQARKVQTLIRRAYARVFEEVDLLVTPTTPSTAFRIGEKTSDPLSMYAEDVYTVGVNVAGLPGISVPCGDSEGLPVGLQFIGKHWADAAVLEAAYAFEKTQIHAPTHS